MTKLSTTLMIVVFLMLAGCTQEASLPDVQMEVVTETTVVIETTVQSVTETAVSTPTIISSTATSDPTPAASQADTPLLFIRDNDLWRANLNGQKEQRLTTGKMVAEWFTLNDGGDLWWAGGLPPQVHVSPNGRWLAFTQTGRNLVLVDVTEQEPPRSHLLNGTATIFAWSPDSRQVAYSSQRGIFLYDVAVDSFQPLLDEEGGNLVWSPDGRFLAFSCCFSETELDSYEGTYPGEIRQVELATQEVIKIGETWIGIASGSPPLCWSDTGTVGIDVADPQLCSYERDYPYAVSPDGEKTAVLSLRTPDDDAYFRLLLVKEQATDATLWQQNVPQVQTVYWTPDGQWLLLGNSYYNATDAAIYRLIADGSESAQLLQPDALLLNVIPQWGMQ